MPTTDLNWPYHHVDKTWKGLPYHVEKVGRSLDTAEPPKLYAPPHWLNEWRAAVWRAWSSPLLEAVKGADTECTSGVDHGPASGSAYVCHGYTAKGCSGTNPNSWATIGEKDAHIRTAQHIHIIVQSSLYNGQYIMKLMYCYLMLNTPCHKVAHRGSTSSFQWAIWCKHQEENVGLLCLAAQSNNPNCLVLTPHRLLGNYLLSITDGYGPEDLQDFHVSQCLTFTNKLTTY